MRVKHTNIQSLVQSRNGNDISVLVCLVNKMDSFIRKTDLLCTNEGKEHKNVQTPTHWNLAVVVFTWKHLHSSGLQLCHLLYCKTKRHSASWHFEDNDDAQCVWVNSNYNHRLFLDSEYTGVAGIMFCIKRMKNEEQLARITGTDTLWLVFEPNYLNYIVCYL